MLLSSSSCSFSTLLQPISTLDTSTTENYLREVKEKASVIEQMRKDLEAQIICVRKAAGECVPIIGGGRVCGILRVSLVGHED